MRNVKLERGSDTCIGPSPLRLLLLKFLVAILKRIPSSLDSSGKSRLRNEFEWVEESLQRNFEDWRRIERAWGLLKKEKDRSIRNIFSSPRLICDFWDFASRNDTSIRPFNSIFISRFSSNLGTNNNKLTVFRRINLFEGYLFRGWKYYSTEI